MVLRVEGFWDFTRVTCNVGVLLASMSSQRKIVALSCLQNFPRFESIRFDSIRFDALMI